MVKLSTIEQENVSLKHKISHQDDQISLLESEVS
jgi:hypothetical protein